MENIFDATKGETFYVNVALRLNGHMRVRYGLIPANYAMIRVVT
jgi:hypothetical protein